MLELVSKSIPEILQQNVTDVTEQIFAVLSYKLQFVSVNLIDNWMNPNLQAIKETQAKNEESD